MVRLALLLLAVSGCDLAFGVQHVSPETAVCGPYTKVTEVSITGVEAPRGFSISEDESLALVTGTLAGQTRPIPLQFNGSAWEPDMTMQAGLESTMKGANLAPAEATPAGGTYPGPAIAPVMLLSKMGSSGLEVGRYYWSGAIWSLDSYQFPFGLPGYDVFVGNTFVRVGPNGPDDRVRSTVFWMVSLDKNEGKNKLAITANDPFSMTSKYTLADKGRTVGLNNAGLKLGQAVMTEDRSKLVFSAKTGAHADIYAVEQSAEAHTFDDVGTSVGVLVNTANDEVEPWINADCSKLYFRQIPADSPSDPGHIFVAE